MEESVAVEYADEDEDEIEEYEEEDEDEEEESAEGAADSSVSDVALSAAEKLVASEVPDDAAATDTNVRQRVTARVEELKARYTRRMSLFELTGIVAESFNLLCRGRLPLVADAADPALDNELKVVVRELEEGVCPIVIEKNGEFLSPGDFDPECLRYHLTYMTDLWKSQGRMYPRLLRLGGLRDFFFYHVQQLAHHDGAAAVRDAVFGYHALRDVHQRALALPVLAREHLLVQRAVVGHVPHQRLDVLHAHALEVLRRELLAQRREDVPDELADLHVGLELVVQHHVELAHDRGELRGLEILVLEDQHAAHHLLHEVQVLRAVAIDAHACDLEIGHAADSVLRALCGNAQQLLVLLELLLVRHQRVVEYRHQLEHVVLVRENLVQTLHQEAVVVLQDLHDRVGSVGSADVRYHLHNLLGVVDDLLGVVAHVAVHRVQRDQRLRGQEHVAEHARELALLLRVGDAVVHGLRHRVRLQEPEGERLVVEVFHQRQHIRLAHFRRNGAHRALEHGHHADERVHVRVEVQAVHAEPGAAAQVIAADVVEALVAGAEAVHVGCVLGRHTLLNYGCG
ncbi:PP225 [Orf virus]|uniref:DNA-directed RNA polymerase 19 kDa subunit n=1 Tax=Orf virus TaxID=10258 RepID=F1AX98_ORFV|nr:PP225 [Orf virus]